MMPLILEAAKQNCDKVLNTLLTNNNKKNSRKVSRQRLQHQQYLQHLQALQEFQRPPVHDDVQLEDIESQSTSGVEVEGTPATVMTSTFTATTSEDEEEEESSTPSATLSAIMDSLIDYEAFRGPSVMVNCLVCNIDSGH